MADDDIQDALAAAVASLNGHPRPGQTQMATAIGDSFSARNHLLVQAGTGTGKSLGYLIPALVHMARNPSQKVVVTTATLALQSQLSTKDIPVAADAVKTVTGKSVRHAIVKGRSNYACLLKVRQGVGEEQDSLLDGPQLVSAVRASNVDQASVTGAEVVALRSWAEEQLSDAGIADRDEAPSHTQPAWAQVSVSPRECVGAQKCPFGDVCFVEKAREEARHSQLIVTNHALLAIDAMQGGGSSLPSHDFVIIDEAHDLTARVTSAAAVELSPAQLERTARRALPWLSDDTGLEFLDTGDVLSAAMEEIAPGEVPPTDTIITNAVSQIRDVCRKVVSGLGGKDDTDLERTQCAGAVNELFEVCAAIAERGEHDVCWIGEDARFGRQLRQAPLSVAGLMRSQVLAQRPVVMTSATLTVGGDFVASARSVGLSVNERVDDPGWAPDGPVDTEDVDHWCGLDVGSPFDYPRQGILYLASHLPAPTREGIGPQTLDEVVRLVEAAQGRTLGLFSSLRSAEVAAQHVREHRPGLTVLCQGDAQLSELTKRFIDEPETSLFGTLSLWQGVDAPGETCALVIIDKIPFPRPDEPLQQARQRAVTAAGGNGFMQIAAAQAGLLLAQGAGRLIRRNSDRGMVAILDPRVVTARYGSFLRASLPALWATKDPDVAVNALARLSGVASEE